MSSNKIKIQNIHFFNRWAKLYNKEPISLWLLHIQKKIVNQFQITKDSSVLDVGCGTGGALETLAKKGIKKLSGIDLSPEMIKQAKKRLGTKALLKVASVEKIPFQNNTFDFVINTEAFHHFPNPQKSVDEMTRLLKKEGVLYLADINFYSSIIHWLFKKLEPGHVKIYSKEEFKNLFEKAGLKIIKQERVRFFIILTVGRKI